MLAALRHRNFRLLWAAQLISMMGDTLLFIVLPFHVYRLTGSALATGVTFASRTIPTLFGTLAGALVDRWNRRAAMLGSQLVAALALGGLLLPDALHHTWAICLSSLVEAGAVQVMFAAGIASVPQLVPPELLVAANAAQSSAQSLTQLLGPALGGVLFGAFGIEAIVGLDVGTYLASAVVIAAMTAAPHLPPGARTRLVAEMRAGLRLVRGPAGVLVAVAGFVAAGEGLLVAGLVPFVSNRLGGGPQTLSWLVGAVGAGTLVGAATTPLLTRRLGTKALLWGAPLATGAVFLAAAQTRTLAPASGLFALAAAAAAIVVVTETAVLQRTVPSTFLGRLAGIAGTANSVGKTAGVLLAGLCGSLFGPVATLGLAAAAFASGGPIWLLHPAALREASGPAMPAAAPLPTLGEARERY